MSTKKEFDKLCPVIPIHPLDWDTASLQEKDEDDKEDEDVVPVDDAALALGHAIQRPWG